MVTASIVLYNNDIQKLKKSIDSFLQSNCAGHLYLVDHSENRNLEKELNCSSEITYIYTGKNLGFGSGHNIAINKAFKRKSDYHLILNPDIYFNSDVIKELICFMNSDDSIGLIMPKILYPSGEIQYLCKLLPTPIDLILRRFIPFKKTFKRHTELYELRFTNYENIMEVPYLSGCFMFCKTKVLKEIKGFDERFFMYLEDTDLSRRIHQNYKTVYYPKAEVFHTFEKGSYKSKRLLKYHIVSAIKYFNKWGWFFDKKRAIINKNTLKNLFTNS